MVLGFKQIETTKERKEMEVMWMKENKKTERKVGKKKRVDDNRSL